MVRAAANGASLLNGRLYVSGGRTPSGPTKTLYAYNPSTNTWTKRANMPMASACGAQGVIGGPALRVYAGAGRSLRQRAGFYRYESDHRQMDLAGEGAKRASVARRQA